MSGKKIKVGTVEEKSEAPSAPRKIKTVQIGTAGERASN